MTSTAADRGGERDLRRPTRDRRALHAKGVWARAPSPATAEAAALSARPHLAGRPRARADPLLERPAATPRSTTPARDGGGMAVKLRPDGRRRVGHHRRPPPRLRRPHARGLPRAAAAAKARPRDRPARHGGARGVPRRAPRGPARDPVDARRRAARQLRSASPTSARTRSRSSTPTAPRPGSGGAGAPRRARSGSPTTRRASAAATTCARSSRSGSREGPVAIRAAVPARAARATRSTDPTELWPEEREPVVAGRLEITRGRRRPRGRRPHRGLRPHPPSRRHRAVRRPDPARPRPGLLGLGLPAARDRGGEPLDPSAATE